MSIADTLKDARKKKGFSQRKLAMKTGISLGAIQGYEQGRYKPKYEQIEKLSKILEIPVSALIDPTVLTLSHSVVDLFCGDDDLEEITASPEEKALKASLNHAFINLNIIGQKKIVIYAEDLTKIPEYLKQQSDTPADPTPQKEQTTEDPDNIVTVDLTPNAAHAFNPTEEEKKHADEIMKDDSLWE